MKSSRRVIPRRGSSHSAEYEPLTGPDIATEMQGAAIIRDEYGGAEGDSDVPFSWVDYGVFGFVGIAMLWAWNMFLAAAQYFEYRFQGSHWIKTNFQSTILTVSTAASLASVLVLTKIQRRASYPFRINVGLLINTAVFLLLTCSTVVFLEASPRAYFAFVLAMVAATSVATGLLQNGALAFAASFGRPEYMQALVTGQSVAGILPALASVLSVLMFPSPRRGRDSAPPLAGGTTSAFVYFLAAVVVFVVALGAMMPLAGHHKRNLGYRGLGQVDDDDGGGGGGGGDAPPLNTPVDQSAHAAHDTTRKVVPMRVLFVKLRWLALGVALVFATTMFFPVFTAKIRSVQEPKESWVGGLFAADAFIPLAFFFWNLGDFGGRLATAMFQLSSQPPSPSSSSSSSSMSRRPKLLFNLAVLRIVQVPLYLLCNISNRGAVIPSDFFYLFVVQIPFGFTNGWLCSKLMTSAGSWVDEGEREAAGGFMGLCLIIGLAAGSLLSFFVAGI